MCDGSRSRRRRFERGGSEVGSGGWRDGEQVIEGWRSWICGLCIHGRAGSAGGLADRRGSLVTIVILLFAGGRVRLEAR